MKKSAGVFISLYLIFTISGITCDHYDSCKSINEKCFKDSECCFQKCSFSFLNFESYCNNNINIFRSLISYFRTKEHQTGMCSYNDNPENKVIDEGMYITYGLNAGHAVLPPGTKVEVQLAGKKLIITINNQPSKNKDVILELSNQTAKVLNIPDGGKIPCTLFVVSKLEDNEYYKYLKYIVPFITFFTFLFRFILLY